MEFIFDLLTVYYFDFITKKTTKNVIWLANLETKEINLDYSLYSCPDHPQFRKKMVKIHHSLVISQIAVAL